MKKNLYKRSSKEIFDLNDSKDHFIYFLSLIVSGVTLGKIANSAVKGRHEAIFQVEIEVFFADLINFPFYLQELGLRRHH